MKEIYVTSPCTVQAEYLGTFNSFELIAERHKEVFGEHPKENIFMLDKNGNFCQLGDDVILVEKNDLFPVRVFRMLTTSDRLQKLI